MKLFITILSLCCITLAYAQGQQQSVKQADPQKKVKRKSASPQIDENKAETTTPNEKRNADGKAVKKNRANTAIGENERPKQAAAKGVTNAKKTTKPNTLHDMDRAEPGPAKKGPAKPKQ